MDRLLLHQRVKYLVEEGGLYPNERPVTTPILYRVALVLICLEVITLVGDLLTCLTRS